MTAATLRPARWKRLSVRSVLTAVAIAALVFAWLFLVQRDFFLDARAYWSADLDDLYGGSLVGRRATYLYSPAFAQLLWPATLLPWTVFGALFCALNLTLLAWMAGPILAAVLLFLPFSPVTDEITTGNIHLLIAAAIVISFRWPVVWAFPLLTKVTPGVSVLWFAGAREWRSLALAISSTLAVAAISFMLAPSAWFEWIGLLARSSSVAVPADIGVIPGPLWARTVAAAALVLLGGWRGWAWTVPAAAAFALPVTWSSGLSVLVALIPRYGLRDLRQAPSNRPAVAR
jgi:hypothetical protein